MYQFTTLTRMLSLEGQASANKCTVGGGIPPQVIELGVGVGLRLGLRGVTMWVEATHVDLNMLKLVHLGTPSVKRQSDRMADRQTELKTLPRSNFVGGR